MSARLLLSDATPAATLSVAGTVAGTGADKLKTDPKGEACRITGSSALWLGGAAPDLDALFSYAVTVEV